MPRYSSDDPLALLGPPIGTTPMQPLPFTDPVHMPPSIRILLTKIHQRLFDDQLNVKVLKADCNIGDHNVSMDFKRYVGRSIKDYIQHYRMQAAEYLLVNSQLPIGEVAVAIGCPHIQTFYRTFKRHFGYTPSDYRRMHICSDHSDPIDVNCVRVELASRVGQAHG
jgi:AraC-like DNA-binding protein